MSNSMQYLEKLNFENLDIFDSEGNYIKLSDLLENYHRQAKGQELNENNIKVLRDEFAISVLNGIFSNENLHHVDIECYKDSVKEAYLVADMMIERRKK